MSWTKRQFVEEAYLEIGYADYDFDLEPEQLQSGLRRLDSMMATWNGKGIRVGYPLVSTPEDSLLDTETEVPDFANEAIYTNLAIKLAPTVGKMVSQETKRAARNAYKLVQLRTVKTPTKELSDKVPLGQGNRAWSHHGYNFVKPKPDRIETGQDGPLEFE